MSLRVRPCASLRSPFSVMLAAVCLLSWPASGAPAGTPPAKPAAKSKVSRPKPRTSIPPLPGEAAAPVDPDAFADLPPPPPPPEEESEVVEEVRPATGPTLAVAVELGGVLPGSFLEAGPAAALAATLRPLEGSPFLVRLAVGAERHRGTADREFAPPRGGHDPAAQQTQSLLPVSLGASWEAWRGGAGALSLGVSMSLLPAWTRVSALGRTTSEAGVGQGAAFEALFEAPLAGLSWQVHAAAGARHTRVGPLTSQIEPSWSPVLSLLVGLGIPL